MADQTAAAAEAQQADSSVAETGAQETVQPSVNWEERAKEHQSWGTRLAQENAELKAQAQLVEQLRSDDPADQRAALEALGYQVPDEEEVAPVYEPDPRLRQELDELKQWRESLTTEQQQEQHYSSYRESVDPQLTQLGVPEAFLESVADIAYNQLPAIQTPQGPMPDVEGAVKQFKEVTAMFAALPEVQQTAVEGWRKGKKAPHMSPVGTAGTGQPNLEEMTEQQILDWQVQRLQDLSAGS